MQSTPEDPISSKIDWTKIRIKCQELEFHRKRLLNQCLHSIGPIIIESEKPGDNKKTSK